MLIVMFYCYAECGYAECCYAECRGTNENKFNNLSSRSASKTIGLLLRGYRCDQHLAMPLKQLIDTVFVVSIEI